MASCGVELDERRRGEGADEREGLFVDRDGRELKAEWVEGMLNWMLWELEVVERGKRVLMGKSCRVGGALALVRRGVSERVVMIVGGWSSEALTRYVSGVMAAAVGVGRMMRESREGEIPWGWKEGV